VTVRLTAPDGQVSTATAPTRVQINAAGAPAPATATVTGTVVSVNAGIYPGQIQVQVGNAVYTYRVVSATAVSRVNVATNAGGSIALDAVRPGDQVQVTVDQSGTAQAIQVAYREVSGRIVAVTDAGVVVLENGDSFRLNRLVQVVRNGTAVDASTLRPGDVVTMRVNPQTNEVWAVTIRQEAATLTSVNVTPSGRELRAGDVVEVVAAGTPGGRATFSIGGLRTAVPMVESTAQRGTYYGSYTIQPGDSIQGAEVTVRLTAPDGQVSTATAPTRVQINAAGAVPPAASAPMILSPANGSSIKSPFTVTGVALAGSQVKVTADYSGKALLFFNVNGTLGTQVVTVDRSGHWSATFTQGPPVSGVTVTITAAVVDGDGRAISSAATVTTTLD
jgi:ribosomal protein L21E